jgi:hypothetical protein
MEQQSERRVEESVRAEWDVPNGARTPVLSDSGPERKAYSEGSLGKLGKGG